jgi:sugar lactone lactonase YvrE/DNA-binding IclR family transcriptional regulator
MFWDRKSRAMPPSRQAGRAPAVAGAAAIEKALALVDHIASASAPPTPTELAQASGLPRSTLFRLLAALESRGYVRRDARDRGWRLGFRLFALAHGAWSGFDLPAAAEEEIPGLRESTGETVQLVTLDGHECVVVGGADGTQAIRHAALVGTRTPWHASAAGLALVAFAEPGVRAELLAARDAPELEAAIALTRGRGYAVGADSGDGVADLAAPILDVRGHAAGALALTGPAYRLDDRRLHALAPVLMSAARRVSHDAGGAAWSLAPAPRPGPPTRGVRIVHAAAALLGEAPYWSPRDDSLYWVDMLEPALHRERANGERERWSLAGFASAAVPRRRGGVVLVTPSGLLRFNAEQRTSTLLAHPEKRPDLRYNDAKCDPRGRLVVGTLDAAGRPSLGALLCVEADGTARTLDAGFTTANGLAWSPDGATLYFADSARHAVYAYDYALSNGTVRNRRTFVTLPDDAKPDGLAVDSDGGVWIAVWDGWRVERYAPDGRLARTIRLPVPRPTSVAFGGPGLATLFVTTARARLDPESLAAAPDSGALFAVEPGVKGCAVSLFAG